MIEREVDIANAGLPMGTFVCHPERGGPHPVILFLMDAPGMREELRDMARRLAAVGYYVLLPNLYYRTERDLELGPAALQPDTPERRQMFALMSGLSNADIMRDVMALMEFVDADPAALGGRLGCVGYCMSGPFAFTAAATYPDRVAAAASIYGVRLATDAKDSPHRLASKVKGELYFACAETDPWMPLTQMAELRAHVEAAGIRAEVELYPRAHHGFAFPQRAAFDKASAERHWERLFALFRRALG
jgi:carboxymethylenebutenolidase